VAIATLLACAAATLGLLAAVNGGGSTRLPAARHRRLDPDKMLALVIVAVRLVGHAAGRDARHRVRRAVTGSSVLAVNINAMDYVTVARTRGEGRAYVMVREILPNITGPLLADMGLRFVYVVRLLASLSFLGLGIQPPAADWGSLVRENLGALAMGGTSVIAPALAIATLTIAVNLVIDNCRAPRRPPGRPLTWAPSSKSAICASSRVPRWGETYRRRRVVRTDGRCWR
jgi:peptide/nickel transport system permease protein